MNTPKMHLYPLGSTVYGTGLKPVPLEWKALADLLLDGTGGVVIQHQETWLFALWTSEGAVTLPQRQIGTLLKEAGVVRQRYRRISRILHDRCLRACDTAKNRLTKEQIKVLNTVATGWGAADIVSVTVEDYDEAKEILIRLETS